MSMVGGIVFTSALMKSRTLPLGASPRASPCVSSRRQSNSVNIPTSLPLLSATSAPVTRFSRRKSTASMISASGRMVSTWRSMNSATVGRRLMRPPDMRAERTLCLNSKPFGRLRQHAKLVFRKPQMRGARKAIHLLQRRGARNGRGHAFARDKPGKCHFGRRRAASGGNLVQRGEDSHPSRVEILLYRRSPGALSEIRLAAVLAREEARREAVVDDDTHFRLQAEIPQAAFEPLAFVQVVFRLLDLVAR